MGLKRVDSRESASRSRSNPPRSRAVGALALVLLATFCGLFMAFTAYKEKLRKALGSSDVYENPAIRSLTSVAGETEQKVMEKISPKVAVNETLLVEENLKLPNLTLREAAKLVAGPQKKLIFVTASSGYLDFVRNWYASVEKFGYGPKVLFIAEDDEAFTYLKGRWPRQTVLAAAAHVEPAVIEPMDANNSSDEGSTNNSSSSAHTYGTSLYNSLVDRRPEYFKQLIDLKVSFLYNDVDIVWLGDPFPFFQGEYDMWVQEDAILFQGEERFPGGRPAPPIRDRLHALCTCFMMVRPTRASRRLIHRWSRHVRSQASRHGGAVLNQPAFNKALQLTADSEVAVGVLPVGAFPSGYLFFKCGGQPYCRKNVGPRKKFLSAWSATNAPPVMVHNNWLEGHTLKLKRFKAYNLWAA